MGKNQLSIGRKSAAKWAKSGCQDSSTMSYLPTECLIELGKINLLKISLSWSNFVKLTVSSNGQKIGHQMGEHWLSRLIYYVLNSLIKLEPLYLRFFY
jgi:hypothetical protein